MTDRLLHRREFLRLSGGLLGSALLAGCKQVELGQKAVELFSSEVGLDLQIGIFYDTWKSNAVQEVHNRTGKSPFQVHHDPISEKIITMADASTQWTYAPDRLTNKEFFSGLGQIEPLNKIKRMTTKDFATLLQDDHLRSEFGRDIQNGMTSMMNGRTSEKALKQSTSIIRDYETLEAAYPESGFSKSGNIADEMERTRHFIAGAGNKVGFDAFYTYRLERNNFDIQATLRDMSTFYKMWARNDLVSGAYAADDPHQQEQLARRFISTIEDQYLVVGRDFGDFARKDNATLVDNNPVFSTLNLIGGAYHALDIWALSYHFDTAPIKFMVLGDALQSRFQGSVKLASDMKVLSDLSGGIHKLEARFNVG